MGLNRPEHSKAIMQNISSIYVNGQWIPSASQARLSVHNPANGDLIATIPTGCRQDVDAAVTAAANAFAGWAATPVAERVALLDCADADGGNGRAL